jgi:hypothetical protein
MAVKNEKHGKLLAGMKITELLKGSTSPKKQAKIAKELAKRKYVQKEEIVV